MSDKDELDLSHIRRRTHEEVNYWLDQLIMEVKRLREKQS